MNIKRTLLGTFGYVYALRIPLSKALFLPILLLAALDMLNFDGISAGYLFLVRILPMLLYTLIAITTHRMILIGPGSVPEWGLYKLSKREAYFVMYSIALGLIMVPIGLLAFIPTIGILLAMILGAYIVGRLSLVFPAIATDQGWSFSRSWQATANHQILMMVVVIIFPLVMSIPQVLLGYIPNTGFLISLISAFTMVFVVAALSVAFQVITQTNGETSAPDAAA